MDDNLCNLLITKGELKQSIFAVTLETMQLFKDAAKSFEEYYRDTYADDHDNIPVLFTNKNQYQFMLKFGGDVLIFLMHTNVFEFSRDHEVMRTPYIKEDRDRSYCGMIQIFNFLGDSLKYDRVNDLGYMIGRIFINKEGHYYIEGKRDLENFLRSFRFRYIKQTNNWKSSYNDGDLYITISDEIFEGDKLKYFKPGEWKDEYITSQFIRNVEEVDDLPF